MKKTLIGALVGAVMVFLLTWMSWSFMGTFEKAYKYHENQDAIIESLSANISEEGVYFMPQLPPGSSQEERHKAMEDQIGKPTATVIFHPSMGMDPMSFLYGFLMAFLEAWIVYVAISRVNGSFIQRWLAGLALPVFALLIGPWTQWNWMELPYHQVNAVMTDTMLVWAIASLWLAWWAGRGQSSAANA